MTEPRPRFSDMWTDIGTRFLPFADAGSEELPLGRILRLSLFQISVGMTMALLTGVLNRVMIVELGVTASLVAAVVAIPLLIAPARALFGWQSDEHRSALGWKRSPFIWFGGFMQFGGLAIMPAALMLLQIDPDNIVGDLGAALAFLLVGLGVHMSQTAGLALASDLAPEHLRGRVVALLYVMLLIGMGLAALVFGRLLEDFSHLRLMQTIQGAAVVALVLNTVALWKQEQRRPNLAKAPTRSFKEAYGALSSEPGAIRLMAAVGLGAAGFNMQDVLLEPYGGEVLGMSVGATTRLTAFYAGGTLAGFALAARLLAGRGEQHRIAGWGALIGAAAFVLVILSEPSGLVLLFPAGVLLTGFGAGLFSVCTLTAVMGLADKGGGGVALGAWGAVQASAAGLGVLAGGLVRDGVGSLAASGALGPGLSGPAAGYTVVYHIEIALLFAAIIAIGPLAKHAARGRTDPFKYAAYPG